MPECVAKGIPDTVIELTHNFFSFCLSLCIFKWMTEFTKLERIKFVFLKSSASDEKNTVPGYGT